VTLHDDLTVACGQGAVRLVKVQRAGGKAMDAASLLKGFAVPAGTQLV
jgi:methionyl-tRNA formyltransferase